METAEALEVINQLRHVVQNDLQLIDGYIALQQIERARAAVSQAGKRMQLWGRLAALDKGSWSWFLLLLAGRWPDASFEISTGETPAVLPDGVLAAFEKAPGPLLSARLESQANGQWLTACFEALQQDSLDEWLSVISLLGGDIEREQGRITIRLRLDTTEQGSKRGTLREQREA
ncbi:MAG: Spo0B domain-containing protein [Firmicutes bacterium]|nr:Spo0B domain-containing protein [Bacillota bacterium]